MVEHDLPKVETRVRFPSPAHLRIVALFAIMAHMATVQEKIVAMLATVREMRKIVANGHNIDEITRVIADHSPVSQKNLLGMLPHVSSRTMRRRLEGLIQRKIILRRKEGKEVFYLIYPHK